MREKEKSIDDVNYYVIGEVNEAADYLCNDKEFVIKVFRCVLATLKEGLSVRRSVGWSAHPFVRRSVTHELNF